MMNTLMIDTVEGRYTEIFDVPGVYLHAEMTEDNRVITRLQGEFVNIMCEVNPEFKHNLCYENGQKVL